MVCSHDFQRGGIAYENYKKIVLQSKPTYFIILLIFVINISVNTLSDLLMNNSTKQLSVSSLSTSFTIFIAVFLLVNSIMTVTNCFPLALTMGATRKKSLKDIYFFNLLICIIVSIFINLMLLLSSKMIVGQSVVPYLMGYNWNIVGGILFRFITLLLISLTFTSTIMWLISGFKVEGVFNGLARILITLTLIISQLNVIKNYVLWGQNQLFIHIILLLAVSITHLLTYITLIRYEFK